MRIHRSAVGVAVEAPAKVNLFFEVLDKRTDGYHEIETLMVPIGLYDTLYFFKEDSSSRVELDCRWAVGCRRPDAFGLGELPQGVENLVVRAVELLRKRTGARHGAKLRLVKRIPAAAGLGGGSSDAAAALVAANEVWGLGHSPAELASLAAEIGSDVPFFLGRGAAICRGRGEKIEALAGLADLHFVVVRPPAGLSTAAVYGACRPARNPRPLAPLREALQRGDLAEVGRRLFNRLEPAARSLSPWIKRLMDELEKEDCPGHLMSGSGTCCFGLCRHARQARRVARRLEVNGVGMAFAVRASR